MNLNIKNTLTGFKEKFTPLKDNEVSIYVCGVTLYDDIHIGHLKSIIGFEVMRNYFIEQGFQVTFVRNITDVDDKIITKAQQLNINPLALVNEYVDKFHQLLNVLDINPPDIEPRVTQYLKEIEIYIQQLQENGHAYQTEDGIYFNTQLNTPERYPLSKKIVKDLEDNSRLQDEHHYKHHKADFALWKKDDKHGYQSDIFHKQGRPGWHIECSVMHHHTLGKQFDIHGGGRDLIFPHHENEILQSVAHNGVNPAHYWLHNGMMTKDGKKLSKSIGNSIYVKDLLIDYSPEALKLFLNKGQYNQSQEFNILEIQEAHQRWEAFVEMIPLYHHNDEELTTISLFKNVLIALEDDFNTPQAIALLYAAFKDVKQNKSLSLALEILKVVQLLSVVSQHKTLNDIYDNWKENQIIPHHIQLLIEQRQAAKEAKNYNLSDLLRKEIILAGWEIKDEKDGYNIKRSFK